RSGRRALRSAPAGGHHGPERPSLFFPENKHSTFYKGAQAMKEQLEQIRREAVAAMAGAGSAQELDALRVKYLGKKGELTAVLKQMGKLSAEERPAMGQLANEVRAALEAALETKGK